MEITAITAIVFIIGMALSGIVSFFICACFVAEERQKNTTAWDDGYTQGYIDGLNQKGV